MSNVALGVVLVVICVAGVSGDRTRCALARTCEICSQRGCYWNARRNTCWRWRGRETQLSDCPCMKCRDWYQRERRSDGRRHTLNEKIKCPCRVRFRWGSVMPIDNPGGKRWRTDGDCTGIVDCFYHPGARGCITSTDAAGIGNAQQQCCYGRDRNILRPPHGGAGTPDRERGSGHRAADVIPYMNCCRYCTEAGSCDRYLGLNGVRTGNTSHCPLRG